MRATRDNIYSGRELDLSIQGYRFIGNFLGSTNEEAIERAKKSKRSVNRLEVLVEGLQEDGETLDYIKSLYVRGLGVEPRVPYGLRSELIGYLMKSPEEQKRFLKEEVYDNVVNNGKDHYGNELKAGDVSIGVASILYFYAEQLGATYGESRLADELKAKLDGFMSKGHSSAILIARLQKKRK